MKIKNPRILLYAHSTYGLGHISRMCAFAKAIKKVIPRSSVIIISGARMNYYLAQLIPPDIEFVKLPSLTKLRDGTLRPVALNISNKSLFSIREAILKETLIKFRPHVFLVDHFPMGFRGELGPAFKELSYCKIKKCNIPIKVYVSRPIQRSTHSFLSEDKRKKKKYRNYFAQVNSGYDYIFVTATSEIIWSYYGAVKNRVLKDLAPKIFFTGYCTSRDGEKFSKDTQIKRKIELKSKEKMIVVAGGGGAVSFEILKLYLDIHSYIKEPVKTFLFPGPYMPKEEIKYLERAIRRKKNLYLETFKERTDLTVTDWMHAANLFIGMGGYNTLAEILTTNVRSIVIPLPDIDKEQFIHCSLLKERKLIEMIDPSNVNKDLLLRTIQNNLHRGKLNLEQTKHMINGSVKAARKIKALI